MTTAEVKTDELKGSRGIGVRIPNKTIAELDQHLAIGVTRNKLIHLAVVQMLERLAQKDSSAA
jgi:hypothetical protein